MKYFASADGDDLDDSDSEVIKDILSPLGINAGFGTEYQFNENFAVYGEYCFRIFFTSSEITDEDFNSTTQEYEDTKYEFNGNFSAFAGAVGVRFSF